MSRGWFVSGTAGITSFGRYVGMLGDTNGDGFAECAGASTNGPGGGYMLVVSGNRTGVFRTTTITASSAAIGFGTSITNDAPSHPRSRAVCSR